jgi:AbrB family looped-hinge helix DNA binding protein
MVKNKVRTMALTSTISSKGQVTVPAPLRELLNLTPGSRVVFNVETGAGHLVLAKAEALDERLDAIRAGFSEQTREAIAKHKGKTVRELRTEYLQSEAGKKNLRDVAYGKD